VSISEKQKRYLRGLAHAIKPVVMVGQSGLSEAVLAELGQALDAHELVKVKVRVGEREARAELIGSLASATGADLIQTIGQMAVLFRRNTKKPKIALPGA